MIILWYPCIALKTLMCLQLGNVRLIASFIFKHQLQKIFKLSLELFPTNNKEYFTLYMTRIAIMCVTSLAVKLQWFLDMLSKILLEK